jgi:hypothetical protein
MLLELGGIIWPAFAVTGLNDTLQDSSHQKIVGTTLACSIDQAKTALGRLGRRLHPTRDVQNKKSQLPAWKLASSEIAQYTAN